MIEKILEKVKEQFVQKTTDSTDELEQYIIAHNPQTTCDVEKLERDYTKYRFTGVGRQEYYPITL
jgi:hypothetical protein